MKLGEILKILREIAGQRESDVVILLRSTAPKDKIHTVSTEDIPKWFVSWKKLHSN